MSFDNKILSDRKGRIVFNCNQGIEIGRFQIVRVYKFKCPLQTIEITNSDSWNYYDGVFEADDPGRYLIEYVPI